MLARPPLMTKSTEIVLPPTGSVVPNMRSRPNENATSSAVSSSPLWNLTPWRSFSSTVLSSIRFHSVARPGTVSRLARQFLPIRPSQIDEKKMRSPTLLCSRSTSRVLELEIFCTATVIDGRVSV